MVSRIIVYFINWYQRYLRRFLPPSCRFYPSCSEYAREAVQKFGFLKGVLLGVKRILSCHPFSHKCGYDPLGD